MKFTAESKAISDAINEVVRTTGGAEINFEVGSKGLLFIKSSSKGTIHHTVSEITVDDGEKGENATIPVAQFLGLINRRGTVTIEVTEKGSMIISNKTFKGEITLPPVKDVDIIENAKNTMELESGTISKIQEHIGTLNLANLISDSVPMVRIRVAKGILEMFCADDMHLAYYKMHADTQQDFAIDLPYTELYELLSIVQEDPSTQFAVEDSRVFVKNRRTKISFPKPQIGRLIPFDAVNSIKDRCVRSKSPSGIKDIDREQLLQNVAGCKHIASQETFVEFSGHKGKGYSLSYQTSHGRIKTIGDGVDLWNGKPFKIIPFLFDDFLLTLDLYPQVDLYVLETLMYSHVVQGDDYEAFHSCSGN